MLHEGQQSAFPKIKFISNRMKLENAIAEGVKKYVNAGPRIGWRVDDEHGVPAHTAPRPWENAQGPRYERVDLLADNPSRPLSDEFVTVEERDTFLDTEPEDTRDDSPLPSYRRSSSMMQEFRRQSAVFFDDDLYETGPSEEDHLTNDKRGMRAQP